ncbi:ATP-binding protein [Neptunicella sp. SCSIO 80796]|uniref:ATP-binding protein n=1 Tax=Neptunicella plasticusilytica TaxID=3117012 RepID=UPI003A4D2488
MIALSKLNPLNSLFGRIFLWFWLAMLLIIFSTAWIARQAAMEHTLRPMQPQDQQQLNASLNRLNQFIDKRPLNEPELSQMLGRIGSRSRTDLLLLNPDSKQFIAGFPHPEIPMREVLLDLIDQPSAFSIMLPGWRFVGPAKVTINQQAYLLFVGKRMPPTFFRDVKRQPPIFLIMVAIVISGLLCLLLTWSLVKPLRRLKAAAAKMGAGDLTTRSGETSYRHDEIGQLGREFDHMAIQLEQLVSGQKRMLADISHELRSPLARLQVAIGIAQQNADLDIPQLQRIETEAQRIDAMLAQILTLSRLDARQNNIIFQHINLDPLMESLIGDAIFEAEAQNKKIEVDLQPNLSLSGSKPLLASAIENLLRNGIKYANSKVSISLHKTPQNNIELIISDDGPGVPSAELEKIFTPFYRTAESRSRDSGGVGLGLAIAAKAIEGMGGHIHAVNNPQGGLSVLLRFSPEPDS